MGRARFGVRVEIRSEVDSGVGVGGEESNPRKSALGWRRSYCSYYVGVTAVTA